METIPFAWILARTVRAASSFCEPEPRDPRRVHPAELVALGLCAPLLRPEGALASLIAAAALALRPPASRPIARLLALAPLAGPLLVPGLHLMLAGHATSATTMVKWLFANPALDQATRLATLQDHLRLLWQSVLDGGDWTAIFLPEGFVYAILLGPPALLLCARRARLPWHFAFVLLFALGTLIPCTYSSFLWNRVRYTWPFFGAHIVLLACLSRELGALAHLFGVRRVPVTALAAGLFAGVLVARLSWSLTDLESSARAIDLQQVKLGEWAARNLPEDARIGVNDTGAIAYLGGHRTFDVVGLTTEGESRYWVYGPGARFEHYEHLPAERRPTHFIVYPQWMACTPVLGEELTRATVTDQSILGGTTMIAYEARWDLLGSGSLPTEAPAGALADEIDVADLESEEHHAYVRAGASDQDCEAVEGMAPRRERRKGPEEELSEIFEERPQIADGGRMKRGWDRFEAHLSAGKAATLVMRVGAEAPVEIEVRANGEAIGMVAVPETTWVERQITVPAEKVRERMAIEVVAKEPGRFGSFHYWVYQ
jgi:hypothetical protein